MNASLQHSPLASNVRPSKPALPFKHPPPSPYTRPAPQLDEASKPFSAFDTAAAPANLFHTNDVPQPAVVPALPRVHAAADLAAGGKREDVHGDEGAALLDGLAGLFSADAES